MLNRVVGPVLAITKSKKLTEHEWNERTFAFKSSLITAQM